MTEKIHKIEEIHILTGNPGKFKEIAKWLGPLGIQVKMLESEFIEAQVDTLEEVIIFGMEELSKRERSNVPFIKDDSGLFIEELNGFPGVYSAYVQKTISNRGILRLMEGVDNRTATFRTVIGLWTPGQEIKLFSGKCDGTISFDHRGDYGFGYDPIFIPDGEQRTFAEMSTKEKNEMSHRIDAVKKLVAYLDPR